MGVGCMNAGLPYLLEIATRTPASLWVLEVESGVGGLVLQNVV